MIHKTNSSNPILKSNMMGSYEISHNNYFFNCEQDKIENDSGGKSPEDLCNWLDSLDELFLKDKKEQALVINELYNELKAPTSNEKVLLSLDNCLRKMAIINASNNIATVDNKISVQITTDILYSLNMISVERKKTEIVQKVIVSALNVLVDIMGKLQDLLSDGSDGSVEEAQRVFVGLIWSGTFVEYPSILEVLAKGLGNVNGSDTVIEVMICHSISDSLFGNDLQVQKVLKESLAKINFTDIENDLSVKFLNKMNITDPGATGKK